MASFDYHGTGGSEDTFLKTELTREAQKQVRAMIDEVISKKVNQFTAHDLQNGPFQELLIGEFRALKSQVDNMHAPFKQAPTVGVRSIKQIEVEIDFKKLSDRLEKLEETLNNPDAMLKKAIEGFKIK